MIARFGVIAALVLTDAACSSAPRPAPPPATASQSQAQPAVVAQTPIPRMPPPPRDQCGAYELTDLVGKPRSEIPVPVDLSRRRVYCTTCTVTQDYDPTRLDILIDTQTGLVAQVKCG